MMRSFQGGGESRNAAWRDQIKGTLWVEYPRLRVRSVRICRGGCLRQLSAQKLPDSAGQP